jgi:hypothetical protein
MPAVKNHQPPLTGWLDDFPLGAGPGKSKNSTRDCLERCPAER